MGSKNIHKSPNPSQFSSCKSLRTSKRTSLHKSHRITGTTQRNIHTPNFVVYFYPLLHFSVIQNLLHVFQMLMDVNWLTEITICTENFQVISITSYSVIFPSIHWPFYPFHHTIQHDKSGRGSTSPEVVAWFRNGSSTVSKGLITACLPNLPTAASPIHGNIHGGSFYNHMIS